MENVYKEYPIEVAATLISGIMCCDDFSKAHECAEWVMGHPVWTHEFASKEQNEKIRKNLINQSNCKFEGLTKENAMQWTKERKGDVVEINKGSAVREKNPIETMNDLVQ